MFYLEYILILAIFFYAAGSVFWLWRKISYEHFYRLAIKSLLKKQTTDRSSLYFNSKILRETIIFLLKERHKKAKHALLCLVCGKTEPTIKYLNAHHQKLNAALLEALQNPTKAIENLEKILTKNPDNAEVLVELAGLSFNKENLPKALSLLNGIDEKKASAYAKGKKRFYQSFYFLKDGDMLSASECASEAGKLFNKEKSILEEAQSFLLLGTIYRLSCVEDVAKFMFDTAQKIFTQCGDKAGIADTLGNCGMLWVLQEKFAEAADDFEKALQINEELQRSSASADILNQQALMFLLQKKYSEAILKVSQALSLNENLENRQGLAFGNELLAHIAYEQQDFEKTAKHAEQARDLYKKTGNVSAYFESIYLLALAYFEMQKIEAAEKLLRDILTFSKKKKSSFHTASAYNLLGLIFLKKSEPEQAKFWFQEAALLEQKNERYSGAATDYANIAMIEMRSGNMEQARKNLEIAIEHAKTFGETELSTLLSKKLARLKV